MDMKPMKYTQERIYECLYEGTIISNDNCEYKFAILSLGTHPTAYVSIPQNHPYYETYTELDKIIECHGGITYFDDYLGSDKYNYYRTGHWIGWDYAHYGDYIALPFFNSAAYSATSNDKRYTTEEIYSEVQDVINQLMSIKRTL